MINVVVEVRSGAASFRVAVRAQSIQRAVSLVREGYRGDEARSALPAYPGSFFAGDDSDAAELVAPRVPEWVAG